MQLSEDGQFMWNGSTWVPVQQQQAMPQMQQPQMQQPQMQQPQSVLIGTQQPSMQQPHMQQQMYGGQQVMQGNVQNQAFGFPQQHIIMSEDSGGKRVVPWIGVGAIILGLLLPFVSVLGFGMSGFQMMGLIAETMDDFSGADSGDDFDDEEPDLGFGGWMMVVAGIMFALSPFIYLLSGIISGILLAMKKRPKLMGIIHLSYFGVIMISATLASMALPSELDGFSLTSFLGFGFYMSSLGAALFFVDK